MVLRDVFLHGTRHTAHGTPSYVTTAYVAVDTFEHGWDMPHTSVFKTRPVRITGFSASIFGPDLMDLASPYVGMTMGELHNALQRTVVNRGNWKMQVRKEKKRERWDGKEKIRVDGKRKYGETGSGRVCVCRKSR